MDNEPGGYLQVPITEKERARSRSRSTSIERLLPQHQDLDGKEYSSGPTPNRFGSLHGESSRGRPQFASFEPDAGRYAPIESIYEEDVVDAPPPVPLRQRTIHQADKYHQPLQAIPLLWRPFWLKSWVLALFALSFFVFMAVVIVLWITSQNNNGWHVDNPHGHPFWVYIPTIILVFLVAGWRQVDYHTKSLTPWDELQKGPVSPHKSLLLDYISPFQIVSLFKAFIHGHVPIIASASSFVLLKIVMVFSTGFLILLPTDVTQDNFGLLVTSKFDTSSFDPRGNLSDITSAPVYAYYGALAGQLASQPGVLANLAYNPVTIDNSSDHKIPRKVALTADMQAFMPNMSCQTLDAGLTQPARLNQSADSDIYGDGSIGLTLPRGTVCASWGSINVSAMNPQTQITPSRQSTGTFQAVYCARGDGSLETANGPAGLLYTILDVTYQQDLYANASDLAGGNTTITTSSSRTVEDMSNVICKPSYVVSNVTVRNDTAQIGTASNGVSVQRTPNSTNNTFDNFSSWNMSTVFAASVSQAKNMFGRLADDDIEQASTTLFTLMSLHYNTKNISTLLDAERLKTAAATTFEGVMAQYASQRLVVPSNTKIQGTVEFRETRYHVNGASAIAMIIALAAAASAALVLIVTGPKGVVPRDPNSIAALATTLTRSIELNRLLRREGLPSTDNQESALEGYEFGTAIATTEAGQSSFKIVTSEGVPENIREQPGGKLKWWRPITSSLPFTVIAVAAPLILIVVLESLQRSSDRKEGIHSVPDDEETDIFTHFIPALVMLIVASLVNLVEFNIEVFAPWSQLADGNAPHRRSLLMYYLGRSPPTAFLEAIRTRRFNVILAIIATTFASILTIVVTGLFSTDNVVTTLDSVPLSQTSQLTFNWADSFSNDNGAAGLLDLVMHQNRPYPDFTFGDLVFPQLSMDTGLSYSSKSTLSDDASVIVPASRANLNCYDVKQSGISVAITSATDSAFETDQAMVNVAAPLPENCSKGGPFASADSFQYEVAFSLGGGEKTYGGRQIDLLFGENANFYGNGGENNGQYIADNPPIGCPSIALTFGEFTKGSNDSSKVTAMVCYQQIYDLNANVTLIANTTTIDSAHPPVILQGSAKLQTNPLSSNGVASFDFRIQENIARQFMAFGDAADTDYDRFFQAALNNGTPSVTPQSLVGSPNQQMLYDALNLFYGRYMAQAMSLNMRGSTSPSSFFKRQSDGNIGQLSATITTPRLIQNRGPKLALQVLLALVSVCIGAAWMMTRFSKILPCNPCSIAGTMSLLAGSDLCHTADDGACECCGKPRKNSFGTIAETIHADQNENADGDTRPQMIKDGAEWLVPSLFKMVFSGKRYAMGWWRERPQQGKRRRYGIDVGGWADGRYDEEWELGKRKRQNTGFRGFMEENMPGNVNRDGKGLYYHPGHSRRMSVEVEDGDLGRPGGRGVGREGEDYSMSGAMRGEA